MDPTRAKPSKRPVIHLSRPPKTRGNGGGRIEPVEEGAPNPALSRATAVTASQEAATTLLQAAEVAAASLGQQEVDQGLTATDILKDQSSRTTASRSRQP